MGTSTLDPKRRKGALTRVNLALAEAAHHEKQAISARARAATMIRTWELCPIPQGSGFCCNDPDSCEGRSQ